MKTSVVVGLQYGDEGKGLITSYLSHQNDLVVRFNGGHQAGHTVVRKGHRHVFSSFGAGTLKGAHTYCSEYCTFYPEAYLNERESLFKNGFKPVHYIHPLAMVTTPFDIEHNQNREKKVQHGSVGVGFGATIARQDTPYKLYAIDLTNQVILAHKLGQIAKYYKVENPEREIEMFLHLASCLFLNIFTLDELMGSGWFKHNNIIFEGAQGIMLDMEHGYFPNVTRSNTTSKNAMKIIIEHNLPKPEIYYVMRSYLTRHGNGFMPNEDKGFPQFMDKTNGTHEFQGNFRQGFHSTEQLKYALKCDSIYSGRSYSKKNLAITCLDQTGMNVLVDSHSEDVERFLRRMPEFDNVIMSTSDDSANILSNQYSTLQL